MPTLSYFDFDASRGLECRLALAIAGVDFEDVRIPFKQWPGLKPTVPFGALPVYADGERRLAQSSAILRYVGRTHGLHPEDPWTAAQHDALMDAVEDFRNKMPGAGLSDADKKAAREEFARGWMTQWAKSVSEAVKGPFIQGDAVHVADLKLYCVLRAVFTDTYDHLPAAALDPWPSLRTLHDAVAAHPAVKAWFAARAG